ncbi:hypothetical protein PVL29_000218 [Vitis rotundifolia]|uniref:HD domain-containing protein n=1 Tax=Vitis rotundifolia TaxID=103349 RepID=A0AA39AI73_VITRO|nr:hypothetical protein PVL29_000218 [Vitis rotundifolia]
MAVHLNWSLPTQSSSLAFLHRTFQEAPAPPRLLSVRSQKLSSGSGDPFLSNASGVGPRKSANLDRPEASIGSSGSSSSSSSSSSVIDFLTFCHRFKTIRRKGWINHGRQRPEPIAHHIYRLMALIAGDIHGVNRERCIKLAIMHDIIEVLSDGNPKKEKSGQEWAALKEIHEVIGGEIRGSRFCLLLWKTRVKCVIFLAVN